MAVNTTHKDYDKSRLKWKRCRDVIAGRDAVLSNGRATQRFSGTLFDPTGAGDVYLPRLSAQTVNEYAAYAERAGFFNATGRTLDALTGMIFAKDPQWKLPPAIEPFTTDISLSATNLREFSEQMVEQQIAVGRVGIMADYPADVPAGVTVAVAERMNIRPFLRLYKAETILNWRTSIVNSARVLTMVVLQETTDVATSDFVTEEKVQYRVLDLTPEGYRVRIFDDQMDQRSEVFPLMRGQRMNFIPFEILGANSCDDAVQKPPLIDLVDTNLAHYRNSADYEHGLHFTGLPTPYVAGVQLAEGQTLSLGSMTAWVFPDPQANVGFLEFTGAGLGALETALKSKEQRMAVLGARMLADDKRTAEAFGTTELKTAGERSVLASISRSASDAMTRALNWMARWVGAPEDAEFTLNTDFGASRMQPQMLTALMGAYQGDAIPLSVLFDNLQRGEIISPTMEFEEYQAQLEDQGPSIAEPTARQDREDPETQAGENNLLATLRNRLGL